MKYRKLGNTGLIVSEIGFGTIPILSGNIPVLPNYYSPDDQTAINIMKHALNLGCNFFDTAIVPEYGDAEIKLGKFANSIDRNKIIISNKSRFFHGGEMYDSVIKSCENLNTYPDIYFVHQVDQKNEDITFGKYGAVDALSELKLEGKIKFAGIASHYYDILLRGVKDNRVDVLQGSGNIFERGMLDRIQSEPLFKQKGFILNKVYAAGILPTFFPIETLLSGVLSYSISTALIGIGTFEQVDAAMLKEVENYKRPTFSNVISVLEKSFEPIPCTRCQLCKCPYGIEIHTLFRQYNYYFLGKDYWSLRKLELNINESALHCKKCTDMSCMKKCPNSINIPSEIQIIRELVRVHVNKKRIF